LKAIVYTEYNIEGNPENIYWSCSRNKANQLP
jgi:hypothetical protein